MFGSEHTGRVNRAYNGHNGGVMTGMVCGEVKFFYTEFCERHTHNQQPALESASGCLAGQ
jgi:hypothetical protein